MSERRFLVPPGSLAAGAGTRVILRGDEHHHLARVLRLAAGDAVGLFDGAGAGCLGRVERIERDATQVMVERLDDRAVEPRRMVTLAQAIPRNPDRMDLVVQKTTEVGVSRIVPVVAERSVARPGQGSRTRLERWRRIAADAARQSGRLRIPAVDGPVPWEEFLRRSEESDVRLVLSTEDPAAAPLAGAAGAGSVIIAVGPEGGWSDGDLAGARAAGYRSVRLGPRILRSETAGIVAVALALYEAGDLS